MSDKPADKEWFSKLRRHQLQFDVMRWRYNEPQTHEHEHGQFGSLGVLAAGNREAQKWLMS